MYLPKREELSLRIVVAYSETRITMVHNTVYVSALSPRGPCGATHWEGCSGAALHVIGVYGWLRKH